MMKGLLATIAAVMSICCAIGFAAEESATDWVEAYSYFVGEWHGKLDDGTRVEYQIQLSPTKTCFIEYLSMNGKPVWHGVTGYDPLKKCVVLTSFTENGMMSVFRWDGGSKTFEGSLIGKTIQAAETQVSKTGDVEDRRWTLTVVDEDKHEWRFGDVTLVMERK